MNITYLLTPATVYTMNMEYGFITIFTVLQKYTTDNDKFLYTFYSNGHLKRYQKIRNVNNTISDIQILYYFRYNIIYIDICRPSIDMGPSCCLLMYNPTVCQFLFFLF